MSRNLIIFFSCICSIASCQENKERIIVKKDICYQAKLNNLRNDLLYNQVFSQFKDTFRVLISQKAYFGVPGYADNKIDDALFFNKDSTRCILLVIQKPAEAKYVFGSARVIYGRKFVDHWVFEIGPEYYFEKDYFELYKDNNFENISRIARYSVMVSGKPEKDGCDIDHNFWFVQMSN